MFRLLPRSVSVFCCLVASLAVSACGTVIDGSVHPAADLGTSPPATTTAPVVVPATGLEADLLTRSELAAIVGDTDFREVESYPAPDTTTQGVDPRKCAYRAMVATSVGYMAKGRRAIVGNTNRGSNGRIAAQVVSVWEDHNQPRDVLFTVRLDWALCRDGQQFTVAASDGEDRQSWVAGQISTVDEVRASTVMERQESPEWTCHHILAIHANVAVETMACGEGDTAAQANEIADSILARFPR